MKLHYLEIVSSDMEAFCQQYELEHKVKFSDSDQTLGGAKTCRLADSTILGVRAPLRETETPIIRPYWRVSDIKKSVENVKKNGAKIAMEPLEIPGKGSFAIYIQGGIEHGFWQL